MSNKRGLKAFVCFDGSGRIVAGSLILRRNKPKVGKWHEILAYECCNPTTTTTIAPTTTTTTTGIVVYSYQILGCCGGDNIFVYSLSPVFTTGINIYYDMELTFPYFTDTSPYISQRLNVDNSKGCDVIMNDCISTNSLGLILSITEGGSCD